MTAKMKMNTKGKKEGSKDDKIAVTCNAIENMTKEVALSTTRDVLEEKDFSAFRIGGLFSIIQANGYWEGITDINGEPYQSMATFMEGEYGIKYRKGKYFMGIYNALAESNVPWETVKVLGWTKLIHLAPLLTLENVDDWVEKALKLSVLELIAVIKAEKEKAILIKAGKEGGGSDPIEPPKIKTMTFKVHPNQAEVITSAIEQSKAVTGTEFKTVALEYLCQNFIEGSVGKVKTPTKITPPASPFDIPYEEQTDEMRESAEYKKHIKKLSEDIAKQMTILGAEQAFTVIVENFPKYDVSVEER